MLSLAGSNCKKGGLHKTLHGLWFHSPVFVQKNAKYRGKLLCFLLTTVGLGDAWCCMV